MRLATSYTDLSGRCQIRPISDADFERLALPRLPADAVTWLYQNPTPMGIGGLLRVPGKPTEGDIFLLMQDEVNLRTDGARMMRFLLEQAAQLGLKRVCAVCDSMQTPYARLMSRFGFTHAYEEWDMWRMLPQEAVLPDVQLRMLPEAESATLMRRLYKEGCADKPWYLPYVSDTHLLDEYGLNSDLLFLYVDDEPVGFVGVRYVGELAEVELLGLLEAYRTAQWSKRLMQALLYHLVMQANCQEVSVTMWRTNFESIKLAQSFGFHRVKTRTYLELNLAV